jgi:DNA-binding FadR family transcriptional regulator
MEKEPDGENFMSDLDCAFHKKLVDITHNSVISLIVESVQTALINVKRMLHMDHAFLMMVCEGHKRIVSALKERDAEKASQVMLQHILEVEAGMLACRSGGMVLTETGVLKPDQV